MGRTIHATVHLRQDRWADLSEAQRESYTAIVPNVRIESRSKTDSVLRLQAKLKNVRSFGADYVLLIDASERATWSEGIAPEGLVIDLDAIYDA